jgi:phosphomannomutase/phosphoglucomutase
MGQLFGTNGVRGIVNADLTVEKVARLAAAAGSVLGKNVAVGRDGRTSSPMFRDAAVGGLLSVGCSVHDVGVLPTPALQYAVKRSGLHGGLMVTASHNPPEFNGVKVIAADGVEIPRRREEEIANIFLGRGPELCAWDRIGTIHQMEALGVYMDAVMSHVNRNSVRKKRFRVALDPGNGVAALAAPAVARELGSQVFTINADIDGSFPARDSEPRPDNLDGLRALVDASGADVGVAFDGDGDRAIFVDEGGDVHWGDRSFALVAKDFLARHPGQIVATPVSSSRMIEDVVTAGGGRVLWTRVGSVVVSRTMVENGIALGGEENGGIIYGPHQPVRDGSMAMALILDIMAREGRPLSELLDELPRYIQVKDRVACPDRLKQEALEALSGLVRASRVETIDGLKLWYADGSWILVRPSGTEPVFRLYAEAKDQGTATGLVEKHKDLIGEVVRSLG